MKISILGAAGVRTPLIVEAMIRRQERIGLTELALMDIDPDRLEIIGALTAPLEHGGEMKFKLTRTTDARLALQSADYVITTFRVGGIASRVIDERVPLAHHVLGQETTGPGGFAMGLRSAPVLLEYIELMRQACPGAWLINFANPAGMMTEAIRNIAGWERSAGICDAPTSMARVAAAVIGSMRSQKIPVEEVFLDYFGLNHLGWVRAVFCHGKNYLPELIQLIQAAGGLPEAPFDPGFISALGMIPNEYLYYYYNNRAAVDNILKSGRSRGEQLAAMNETLLGDLRRLLDAEDLEAMQARYQAYLHERGETYMTAETGHGKASPQLDELLAEALAGEGYAGVAMDLIEALSGARPRQLILNIPNQGAISGMEEDDVVEIPAFVGRDLVRPLAVEPIPGHCLGLMKQVKAYEKLTVEAAVEGSYQKARLALSLHPLVPDSEAAGTILDEYMQQHGDYFPRLT